MPTDRLKLPDRMILPEGEPLELHYPDGRTIELNTPRPGRVRVTNGIGVVTELDSDEFVRREKEPLQ